MKPVVITNAQWNKIKNLLLKEHPLSTFMLRSRMREKLGFTPRDHNRFDKETGWYKHEVHLDFFSEKKRTLFLLKFSEELNEPQRVSNTI